ncbi:MAG: hypothetical protein ACD_79C01199G0001, partial [uncultured bacterium]
MLVSAPKGIFERISFTSLSEIANLKFASREYGFVLPIKFISADLAEVNKLT